MATNADKRFFGFGNARSPQEVRRKFIEAPLDASVPEALGTVVELASVLTRLPDVFAASQKKELERIRATAGPNDPRAQALQASIDHTEEMRGTAKMGQARVQRVATAAFGAQKVFHGFVSTPDLVPLAGVTVRLTTRGAASGKASTTTGDDGYFSITLAPSKGGTATKKGDFSFAQRINRLFETGTFTDASKSAEATKGEADESAKAQLTETTVQILRKSKLLHEDPIPLKIGEASVYREYLVTEDGSPAEDLDEFFSVETRGVDDAQPGGASKKRSRKK